MMMSEHLEGFLKYVAAGILSVVGAIGGWRVLRFINDWRKGTTERIHLSKTTELSTTELQDQLYRKAVAFGEEGLERARQAEEKLATLQREIDDVRYRLDQSKQCLIDCVETLKELGHHAAEEMEKRARRIHG